MKYLFALALVILMSCNSEEKPKIVVSDATVDSIIKVKQAAALVEAKKELTQALYDTLHVAFEGYPDEKRMQGLFEAVLLHYKMPVTTENVKGLGSLLISLRKQSKVGVTEMDILQHIYQNKNSKFDLPTQAEFSFNIIEKTK